MSRCRVEDCAREATTLMQLVLADEFGAPLVIDDDQRGAAMVEIGVCSPCAEDGRFEYGGRREDGTHRFLLRERPLEWPRRIRP